MTTLKAPISNGKRCWRGAFRPCLRRLARPKPNGIQEQWWLQSASSIGCVGWESIHQPGIVSIEDACDQIVIATDADECVVRRAAFSLSWLDVFLVLESFFLLLLSRELPCLGRSIGQMYCCSAQASICTY